MTSIQVVICADGILPVASQPFEQTGTYRSNPNITRILAVLTKEGIADEPVAGNVQRVGFWRAYRVYGSTRRYRYPGSAG